MSTTHSTKHFFDNRYGTGQCTLDGVIRATNLMVAGSVLVVVGYGWCGKGVAMRARGMGANVIVTEINPIKGDRGRHGRFPRAADDGGREDRRFLYHGDREPPRHPDREHFEVMKDGAIVCNWGHFNVEIDIPALEKLSKRKRTIREFVDEYTLSDGRKVNLLGEGRLINLASAEGHPSSVMDMSFANQALSAEFLVQQAKNLEKQVYPVPPKIDAEIARLKLEGMGVKIDKLTKEQEKYLASWEMGT
ncbi:MAG: adenosylhomocysteinase [Candidatus Manganitrophus sp.]|nr:adenosylhomocysteinase [Candidatus Manganitrophus sp.]